MTAPIAILGAACLLACEKPDRALRFSEAMATTSRRDAPESGGTLPVRSAAAAGGELAQAGGFSEGLAPARRNSRYGYIDTTGRVAVTPRFDHAGSFSGGLAPVLLGGKWGYADTTGKLAIPAAFDWAGVFCEGRAAVAADGSYRFIDTAGDSVGSTTFSDVHDFSGGLAAVRFGDGEDAAWGFVDRNGELVIPPLFADVPRGFSEGYAAVTVAGEGGSRAGFIDTSGGFAMDSLFDAVGDFSGGLAPVARGEASAGGFRGTWHYVDSSGARVLPGDFAWAGSFRGERALARLLDGSFVLIDRKGSAAEPVPDSLIAAPRLAGGRVTYELRNARWDGASGGRLARTR